MRALLVALGLLILVGRAQAFPAVVHSPAVPQVAGAGDIVGLLIQNPTASGIGKRAVVFGQAFAQGAVPAGDDVTAFIGGVAQPTQMDPKTFYLDGSVRFGVVTMTAPAIAGNGSVGVMLRHRTGHPSAPKVTLVNPQVEVTITIGTTVYTVNPWTLPLGDFWLRGARVTERRVTTPVAGSLRLVFDMRTYAGKGTVTDIQFNNDLAMQPSGGTVNYTVSIKVKGVVAYTRTIKQFQYEDWRYTAWGGAPPVHNIVHDVDYLERIGVIPNFSLADGVAGSVLDDEAAQLATNGFGNPLTPAGITQYMPQTGGRGDIGVTTQANAAWLVSQDATAAKYALAQANAAAGIPWHFWNPATNSWLNTDDYPNLWIDPRGGNGPPGGLTQQVNDPNNGWTTDTAHPPALSYVPYLLTGQRFHLDMLTAQASYVIMATWPDPRNATGTHDNVIADQQVRAGAWSMRAVGEAAWANPDGSPAKTYYSRVEQNNWHWLVAQGPVWTGSDGETAGYIHGDYRGGGTITPPWQQDHFGPVSALAVTRNGNADARAFMQWALNFQAQRFLAPGWNPRDGCAYDVTLAPTWVQAHSLTVAAGQSNGTGWGASDGDFCALAEASLAGLIDVLGSPQARSALDWLRNSGAPYIDLQARQTEVQANIVPR